MSRTQLMQPCLIRSMSNPRDHMSEEGSYELRERTLGARFLDMNLGPLNAHAPYDKESKRCIRRQLPVPSHRALCDPGTFPLLYGASEVICSQCLFLSVSAIYYNEGRAHVTNPDCLRRTRC